MNKLHRYRIKNSKSRQLIDLRSFAAIIEQAIRTVIPDAFDIMVFQSDFTFGCNRELSRSEVRRMGEVISCHAPALREHVTIYTYKGGRKSRQLFVRV